MSCAMILLAYDENDVKPGWVALGLVVLLGLATFLLWRSMNTQLGKIRAPHQADLDAEDRSGSKAPPPQGQGSDPDPDAPEDPAPPR